MQLAAGQPLGGGIGKMLEYRRGGAHDVDSIADIHTRSWRENYRGDLREEFLDGDLFEDRRRVWHERLHQPAGNQLVLVAVDAPRLVGFVCAYGSHDPEWGSFIDNLHVAGAAKREGIGWSLMQQVGAWLASAHADEGAYLWVFATNSPARQFYECLGARNAGVSEIETPGGGTTPTCRYIWSRPDQIVRRPPSR